MKIGSMRMSGRSWPHGVVRRVNISAELISAVSRIVCVGYFDVKLEGAHYDAAATDATSGFWWTERTRRPLVASFYTRCPIY